MKKQDFNFFNNPGDQYCLRASAVSFAMYIKYFFKDLLVPYLFHQFIYTRLTKSVRVTFNSNIDPPLGEYYHSFCFQKRHVPFRACWQGWMENQYPSALISRVQFVISYLCAWLIRRWPTLFPRQKSTKRTGSK